MKQRIINKKRNQPKNEINKLKHRYPEGNHKEFFTFDMLGYSDYCDCYFTGLFQNKKVLFNAAFMTLRMHADDVLYDLVNNKMDELFPDRYDNRVDWKEKKDFNTWFNGPKENRYKDWALQQQYDREEEKIRLSFLENGIEVQPYVEVLPDYEFGIGLHGAFDCTTFNKQYVIEVINSIRSYNLLEYSKPKYLGEKRKVFALELEQIQRSTPLIIKSKTHGL